MLYIIYYISYIIYYLLCIDYYIVYTVLSYVILHYITWHYIILYYFLLLYNIIYIYICICAHWLNLDGSPWTVPICCFLLPDHPENLTSILSEAKAEEISSRTSALSYRPGSGQWEWNQDLAANKQRRIQVTHWGFRNHQNLGL